MNRNREDRQGVPNRSSNMEPAEGSRETAEPMSGSDRMRNRESSPQDLGSTSDRAMFAERGSAESRNVTADHGIPPARERGPGSPDARNREQQHEGGGITNRELEREQQEQDQLPERGRSQSER